MLCYVFLNKPIELKDTSFCYIVILISNFDFLLIKYCSYSQLEKHNIIFLILNL